MWPVPITLKGQHVVLAPLSHDHCIAVEFRTHFGNLQSRNAIARLGAKQDGILRSHKIGTAGELRDTVVFSILASEWPMVRVNLDWKLEKPRP